MHVIFGLLRIVLGLGVMGFAGYIFLMHYGGLSGPHIIVSSTGQEFDIGQKTDALPQAIVIGIGAAGLFGLLLFSAGILTLLRKPKAQAPASPTTDWSPPARSS